MSYARLKKFIGDARCGFAKANFSCGIRYWRSFTCKDGLHSVNIAYGSGLNLRIMCRDNSEQWREKLDRLTSSADYDLIVNQSTPQTQAADP